MAKVIGFTGAHGVGKSTITQGIAARGIQHIAVDSQSMPRYVQQTFYPGLTLAEIVSDPDGYTVYQDRILDAIKGQLALHRARTDVDVVLVDRTAIDLYAYAAIWNRQHSDRHRDWLLPYRTRCAGALLGADMIFIVPPRKFAFVAQTDRASEDTQREHHENIKSFLRMFMRPFEWVRPFSVEDRIDFCLQIIDRELRR